MANPESIHAGHRERLRARYLAEGLDSFNEINALELLLFYVLPRRDTNILAHHLIDYFGSYCAVLNARPAELKKVEGVSDSIATYLSLQGAAVRYYMVKRKIEGTIVRTTEDYGNLITPYFLGLNHETVYLLCLDAKCKVLCCREISEGSVNSASISMRKLMDVALSSNATSVILAHNHPSGLAVPSAEDVQTTQRVEKALSSVDVILVDHLIVADGDYISMAQSGYFRPMYW